MHKQIIFYFLLFIGSNVISQNKYKFPIYEKNEKIGYLNRETIKDCNNCYYFNSRKIFNKSIVFKVPATIKGQKDKIYFTPLYELKISTFNKNTKIIEFNITISGDSYSIYIYNNKSKLYFTKKLSYANSSYQEKDGQGGIYGIPSSYICIQNINKKVVLKDYIDFEDLSKFNKIKDCFHCPNNYTINECIKIRNKKKKFNWK